MRKRASNKILSFALAAVMMFTLLPMAMVAYATVDIGTGDDLATGTNLTGTQVYFGSYDSTSNNGNSNGPIKWYVVATDSNTATLWTTTSMGKRAYDTGSYHNYWKNSTICTWLNGTSSGSFLYDAFTDAEQEAINPEYGTEYESFSWGTFDTRQKIVLPSYAEMTGGTDPGIWNIDQNTFASVSSGVHWWLRSPGANNDAAAIIYGNGNPSINATPLTALLAIRPAFKLDLSSVLFTSAAEGGKSTVDVGDGLVGASAPTGAVKLTVEDSGQATPTLTFGNTTNNTSELRFGYTGAETGTNQYVSCVLEGSGKVKYYSKLADCATDSRGTLSVPLSGVTDGTYTLKIFSEHTNGNNLTDFCSTPVTMTVTVDTSGNGTVSGFGGTVDNTAPTVSETSPANSAQDVAITTNTLSVTFNEVMNTTLTGGVPVGAVSLTPSGTTLTFVNWTDSGTKANYSLSGLVNSETYTFDISGFEDVTGNVMTPNSGNTFTTGATAAQVSLTAGTLQDGIENESYSHDLSGDASGGVLPYSFELENSSLPSGLSLSTDGVISGTPDTAVDNHTFTVKVTDSTTPTAQTDTAQYSITIQPEGAPVPQPGTGHTVTVLNDGNGTAYATPAVATAGTTISLTATPNANYSFSRWEAGSPSDLAISGNSFEMPDEAVTVKALFTRNNTTSRNRASNSGNRSHTSNTMRITIPSTLVVDAAMVKTAIAEMKASGANKARIRHNGEIKVPAELWQMFGNVPVDFDTVDENGVQVRITVREPGKMTGEKLMSGYVKGSAVDSSKAFFEKWFKNKVQVIHFDQQGDFGQPLEIAAKVDLTGMDTDNLYFYSYDKATNTYRRIENPDYWIDKKGYLHFTTKLAGDIIISEGPRERK